MVDLADRRLHDLRNLGHDRAVGNFADRLLDNSQRLPHLLHANNIPVESIAVLAGGNFEVEI